MNLTWICPSRCRHVAKYDAPFSSKYSGVNGKSYWRGSILEIIIGTVMKMFGWMTAGIKVNFYFFKVTWNCSHAWLRVGESTISSVSVSTIRCMFLDWFISGYLSIVRYSSMCMPTVMSSWSAEKVTCKQNMYISPYVHCLTEHLHLPNLPFA